MGHKFPFDFEITQNGKSSVKIPANHIYPDFRFDMNYLPAPKCNGNLELHTWPTKGTQPRAELC